ncbi:hypothetical protein [Epilithonimonas hominis]|uniref:hypothetical protein n=1 Tax=Epilithonimonas hominis TaxID=420404 RepID=UPI000EDFD558|nr:hypothetical protein [Epilithonimonas hominis]HAP95277.1 hypothetical protein [Chryseobacterium sp.]
MVDYKVFDDNLFLLEKIFGKEEVLQKLERLKFIYKNTEESWFKNLEHFQDSEVKYILICEAPPYSESEIPVYFYNEINRKFNTTIWNTFFDSAKPALEKKYYKKLAEKGFLLIDNLPYSMNFEKHRKKQAYKSLMKGCLEWILNKLNNKNLKFSEDLKIVFGFKINGEIFIEVTNGILQLNNGRILNFDKNNIAYDGSGIPNTNALISKFFDKKSIYRYYNYEEENPFINEGDFQLNFSNPKS